MKPLTSALRYRRFASFRQAANALRELRVNLIRDDDDIQDYLVIIKLVLMEM